MLIRVCELRHHIRLLKVLEVKGLQKKKGEK